VFDDITDSFRKFKPCESDYIEKCPYCGSYNIEKSGRNAEMDDTWTQKCDCNACSRSWKFRYTEDLSKVYAELEKPNWHKIF